jgi:hypothetical protein
VQSALPQGDSRLSKNFYSPKRREAKKSMKRIAAFSLLALLVCCFASCGKTTTQLATYEVKGQILQNGRPVPHATVVFHPSFELGPEVSKPRATTNEDGTFTISTYATADGAPEGEYKVTVEQWTTTKPEEGPKSRLDPKFGKPDQSGISVRVASGKNELPVIVLR